MPIIRLKEIRSMTPDQREDKTRELRVELMKLRTMVEAGGKVHNPARIKEIKKTIAQILTVENEQSRKTQD
ncbi:MAG: 50S ribosomal protein L29 [Candidatus Bathyarchaeota archaeon]